MLTLRGLGAKDMDLCLCAGPSILYQCQKFMMENVKALLEISRGCSIIQPQVRIKSTRHRQL